MRRLQHDGGRDELPHEAVQSVDLSATRGIPSAIEQWRGGGESARQGWADAGVPLPPPPVAPRPRPDGEGGFAEGMLVRHATYGTGRVTEVSGYGATRRVRVRFRTAGEKTFAGAKIALEVVRPA